MSGPTANTPPVTLAHLVLVLGAVVLAAVGQLLLKAGAVGAAGKAEASGGSLLLRAATSPVVLAGFATFAVSAVLWLAALSAVPLSRAYPFTAVTYVLILAVTSRMSDEHVSAKRWAGVGLVLCGLLVVVAS